MLKMKLSFLVFLSLTLTAFAQFAAPDYQKYAINNFRENVEFHQFIDFEQPDYALLNVAVFFCTNEQRAKKKLPALQHNYQLEASAWFHSQSMADRRFFNHLNTTEPRRRTPDDRARLAGIANPYIAENIAEMPALNYQQGTQVYILDKQKGLFSYTNGGDPIPPHTYLSFAEAVVAQWMDSPPHRKNILSKDALQLGCGVFLYRDRDFYNMPTFKATQNFQQFKPVIVGEAKDTLPY